MQVRDPQLQTGHVPDTPGPGFPVWVGLRCPPQRDVWRIKGTLLSTQHMVGVSTDLTAPPLPSSLPLTALSPHEAAHLPVPPEPEVCSPSLASSACGSSHLCIFPDPLLCQASGLWSGLQQPPPSCLRAVPRRGHDAVLPLHEPCLLWLCARPRPLAPLTPGGRACPAQGSKPSLGSVPEQGPLQVLS